MVRRSILVVSKMLKEVGKMINGKILVNGLNLKLKLKINGK